VRQSLPMRPMKNGPLFAIFIAALVCYCCGRPYEADASPLEDAVLEVLQSMPPSRWDAEEPPESRAERLSEVAEAITVASRDGRDAAMLLALGRSESNFAGYVGAGCVDIPDGAANCDRDPKTGESRARSYWQPWRRTCPVAWSYPRGSREALFAFALCARKRFWGAANTCRDRHPAGYLAGGFSGYRRGAECAWAPGAKRARLMLVYLGRVQ